MLFIEYNMPADFIDDMTANANSLEQHMSLQTEARALASTPTHPSKSLSSM
jgi:hypothetical protein